MKRQVTSTLAMAGILFLSACGGEKTDENQENENTSDSTEVTENTNESGEELGPGEIPWDFPTVPLKGEPGDYVLCPSYSMYTGIFEEEDPTNETLIWYTSELSAAGEVESDIDFTFDDVQKMPNSLLITIPKGQTAAVGDIVLTWWQTGSGMQRAIVTDASDPTQPKVRYLDLDFDNPATDSESGKSIGATEYQLKPDSFVKLTDPWQEGQFIAMKTDDGDWNNAQIIKVEGNKVLTLGFAGTVAVYDKSNCRTVEMKPSVKPGDMVWADFVGGWKECEVKKVDNKMGVVWVDQFGSEKPISFGQISTTPFE